MSTVLVTVGTTKFDELIQAVDKPDFIDAVRAKGYTSLVVQKGNGSYTPTLLTSNSQGISIECFDYQPNLGHIIASSDLIISHAGSGSIFEGLSNNKPMIVVPNERLMANHQVELAEQLERMQHLVYSSPSSLTSVLERFDTSKLQPYVKGDVSKVTQYITQHLYGAT